MNDLYYPQNQNNLIFKSLALFESYKHCIFRNMMSTKPRHLQESKKLEHIRPSGIRKMFARAQGLEGVISLGIGAPDIPPPELLLKKMTELQGLKTSSYVINSGVPALREKILEQYKETYNLDFDLEGVVVTSGGTQLMFTAFMSMTDPGDEVIIPDPGFVYYPTIPEMVGAKPVPIAMDDEFQINPDEIAEKITSKTRMIVINSPSNPTGRILKDESLKGIADLAIDHDLVILSDEVYEFMVFNEKKHLPMASLAPENTVTLNSFSKTYCIPGWRLGYGIGNKEIMQPISKLHPFIVANAPSLPQWALAEFMGTKGDKEFRDKLCKIMERRAKVTKEEFSKLDGITVPPIEGSFYTFPKVENSSGTDPGYEWVERVFEKAKVVTVPGSEFGKSRNDHFRISFGSASEDKLREAVSRIKEMEEKD